MEIATDGSKCRLGRVTIVLFFNRMKFASTKAYFSTWSDRLKCDDLTADVRDDVPLMVYLSYSARTDIEEEFLYILSITIIEKGNIF